MYSIHIGGDAPKSTRTASTQTTNMPPKKDTAAPTAVTPPKSNKVKKNKEHSNHSKPKNKGTDKDLSQTTLAAQKENHVTNEKEEHLKPIISGEKSQRSNSNSEAKEDTVTVSNEQKKKNPKKGKSEVVKEEPLGTKDDNEEKKSLGTKDSLSRYDVSRLMRHRLVFVGVLITMLLIWILVSGIQGVEELWKRVEALKVDAEKLSAGKWYTGKWTASKWSTSKWSGGKWNSGKRGLWK
ncbi:hypothetical protein UCRPC4_g04432 [Phaeomoniella chlamydospora]|uniref:Uncharacterized protein n=1 Tax=Phaeomoniella chlamydospora TaxID=158046 RepID=A0A0G2EBP8_PHACM|nr:hypothetical protein UCRPC4_g04432 [Phaeomoniella chlamydospora]